MRMDKLTTNFQQALADAQSLAVGRDHQFIEPAHVLAALLEQQGGSVVGILTKAGVNLNLLRSQLGEALDRVPERRGRARRSAHRQRAQQAPERHGQARAGARRQLYLERAVSARGRCRRRAISGESSSRPARSKARSRKRSTRFEAAARSTTRTPKRSAKRSRSTRSISRRAPSSKSSTPSSAATTRSGARSKCCSGARRTTPC